MPFSRPSVPALVDRARQRALRVFDLQPRAERQLRHQLIGYGWGRVDRQQFALEAIVPSGPIRWIVGSKTPGRRDLEANGQPIRQAVANAEARDHRIADVAAGRSRTAAGQVACRPTSSRRVP